MFSRPALGEDLPALLRVRPVEPHDDRIPGHVEAVERREDAARHLVAARYPAEDVEEDRAHLLVARDHLERVDDALRAAAAAEVAEVRRASARVRDDVHGGHAETGAVREDADVPVELHVRHALLARERLDRVGGGRVAPLRDVRMPGSALSSTVNFESRALTSPSGVTISGLISQSMASNSTNAR